MSQKQANETMQIYRFTHRDNDITYSLAVIAPDMKRALEIFIAHVNNDIESFVVSLDLDYDKVIS